MHTKSILCTQTDKFIYFLLSIRNMIRKLIKHGESSLTISLPRSFVKENDLKKGQEIEVKEIDNGLFISAKEHKELRSISIDVSNQLDVIRKILGATYKCGYDTVKINFSLFNELKEIKNILQSQFAGYEIIRQGKTNILIKKISEDNFDQFNNVIRRFFRIINNMVSDTLKAVEKNDFQWLKTISLMKYESDRLADYCRRAINLKFKSDYKRLAPLYVIVEQIEKVSDNYKELCEYISDNKIKLKKETKNLIKNLIKFQDLFYNLFFKFDINRMNDFKKFKDKLQLQLNLIMKKTPKQELQVTLIIDRILNIIFDLNGPLMATCI